MAPYNKEKADEVTLEIATEIGGYRLDNPYLAQILFDILNDMSILEFWKRKELLFTITSIMKTIHQEVVPLNKTSRPITDNMPFLLISEESFDEAKKVFAVREEIEKNYKNELEEFKKKFGFNYPMVMIIATERHLEKFPIGKDEEQIRRFKKYMGTILRMIRLEKEKEEKEGVK